MLVVVGGTAGLGTLLGLGNATILAGLTALFCFMAANGGPLRPDLKILAGFAPAVVVAGAAPRLLAEVSQAAAITLLVVIVFGACLVPALGPRFGTVGLGLGMTAVLGYGFLLTGAASAGQIIGAPALAVAATLVLRLLMGVKDPDRPTRAALADALTDGSAEQAVRLWISDRPKVWQTKVLTAGARFRSATAVLADRKRVLDADRAAALRRTLDSAMAQMTGLAGAVRAKSTPDDLPEIEPAAHTGQYLEDDLWDSLRAVRGAVIERDDSVMDTQPHVLRAALWWEVTGALSWRSAQLRHALRCALGVLVALLVARSRPGDPLTMSFLMATFAIMQPQWRDTLSRASERVLGSLAGAAVLAILIWLLPQSTLLPVALAAMLVGFSVMQSQPLIFNACLVLMTVGMYTAAHGFDPAGLVIEYVVAMALAVAIGLLFGFAAIPGVRRTSRQRFDDAEKATKDLLDAVADRAGRSELALRLRTAARSYQDLVVPGNRKPTDARAQAIDEAEEGFRGLATSTLTMVGRDMRDLAREAARALGEGNEITTQPQDDEQRLVTDMVTADLLRVRCARAILTER
ncbi:MAG: FUSC family protein [Kibdelosporangium sp.]